MRTTTRPDGIHGPTGPLAEHSATAILAMTVAIALGAGVTALALAEPVAVALGLASLLTLGSVARLLGGERPDATADHPSDGDADGATTVVDSACEPDPNGDCT